MHIPRLLRTAQLLERKRFAAAQFHLRLWSCGTTACAVGHAMFDPWFQNEGLRPHPFLYGHLPAYDGKINWDAVIAFYDLDDSAALNLFHVERYPEDQRDNPLAVAGRIREMIGIARGDDEPGDLGVPTFQKDNALA